MVTLAHLCETYGWLPSEIENERAEVLDYLILIQSLKNKRQRRAKK